MKKMVLSLFSFSLMIGLALSNVSAAGTYSYGTKISTDGKRFSSNTYASSDPCSVTSTGHYLLSDRVTVRSKVYYGKGRDPITKMDTISASVPSGSVYYTKVNSKHRVGNNTYSSVDYH